MGARRERHRRTRRRSYAPRSHDRDAYRAAPPRWDAWDATESEAADQACGEAADLEARAAYPVAYTNVTGEDWVMTDPEGRP